VADGIRAGYRRLLGRAPERRGLGAGERQDHLRQGRNGRDLCARGCRCRGRRHLYLADRGDRDRRQPADLWAVHPDRVGAGFRGGESHHGDAGRDPDPLAQP